MPDVEITDAYLKRITDETAFRDAIEPRACGVRVIRDSKMLEVTLTTGVVLTVPLRLLEGIAGAPMDKAGTVEIQEAGTVLNWKELDEQATVEALWRGIFGSGKWMRELGLPDPRTRMIDTSIIGRKGGSVSSPAKARAAALNGKKGGRPKKAKLAA